MDGKLGAILVDFINFAGYFPYDADGPSQEGDRKNLCCVRGFRVMTLSPR